VFANELLDAFPVHRVVCQLGLLDRCVDVRGGYFEEVDGSPTSPAVAQQIADGGGRLEIGQQADVNLAAPKWVGRALSLVDRGYALLLDYGEPAGLLYGAAHPRGTLRCYWRHTMNEEPLCRVGEQDITAHVDLSAVVRSGKAAGAELLGATDQAALLGRLGLPVIVDLLGSAALPRTREWAHRRALLTLVDRDGLGRVKALVFGKGTPRTQLSGFGLESAHKEWGSEVAGWVLQNPPRLPSGASVTGTASPTT
jgi:SAM-dependent MidA family methyltransferase